MPAAPLGTIATEGLTRDEIVLRAVDQAIAAWRTNLKSQTRGRPPRWVWEQHREWIAAVASRMARTNRSDSEVSMTEAVWSCLDHRLAPEGLQTALRQHKTRFSYPPSLRAILRWIAAQIAPFMRGPDRQELRHGMHGNGFLRRHQSENRHWRAGESLCFDDGSLNLVCWVDWPWPGAGKTAQKYGCIVGRFQFLLCEDTGTGFMPGYSFVARPLGSYRAEDALGSIARISRHVAKASRHVLERGTWESKAVTAFHEATGIEAVHTYSPKHKTVEPGFARLWGRMAADEKLSLGRFRGDDEAGNALWQKLRSGTTDPRGQCQSLMEVIALLDRAIGRANTEPRTSKAYGSWVPADLWARDLREHPRARLSDDLWWAWAPVRRELQVRDGGVECNCSDLLGESWLYSFTWPGAHLYNGKRVRVCFDPAADLCRAAVVLLENSPATFQRAGALVTTTAEATSSVPAIIRDGAIPRMDWDGGAIERTREQRAIQRAARQWVFRAFGTDGRTIQTTETEIRTPAGVTTQTRIERTAPPSRVEPTPAAVRAINTITADDLADIARAEARARARGLIPAYSP